MRATRTPLLRIMGIILLLGLVGAMSPPAAWAATVPSSLKIVEHTEYPNTPYSFLMKSDTGGIVFCAESERKSPSLNTVYTGGAPTNNPLIDYLMYYGYSGDDSQNIAGYTGINAADITQLAIWLAIGKTTGNNPDRIRATYTAVEQAAADQLLNDAKAWVAQGCPGPAKGCSYLWPSANSSSQAILSRLIDVTVSFTKTSADATITGQNGAYAYAGAMYDIYRTKDNTKVATITTDDQGHASCYLREGTAYYAVETKAPPGFLKSDKRIEFTTQAKDIAISLTDVPGKVRISLTKKDSATGGPAQPGASLKGAEFTLTSLSTPNWSRSGITDEHGSLVFDGIPLGRIRITETKAPEGYKPLARPIEYNVTAADLGGEPVISLVPESDFLEHPQAFDIEIAKFNKTEDRGSTIEQPAEGVRFDITSKTTNKVVGSITTGKDGYASTKGLWFGAGTRREGIDGALPYDRAGYTISEAKDTVPNGFKRVDDWTITPEQMVNGTTLRYIVNNSALQSRLQIVKLDAETNRAVPLAGFSFEVLDANKKPITQDVWYPTPTELSRFTTGDDGSVTLPQMLRSGTYYVREVGAQGPYLLSQEEIKFVVAGKEEQLIPLTIIKLSDEQALGRAQIKKICAEDKKALAGAEFDVIALEDVVSPDGTVRASARQVVDHVTTGSDGIATTKALYLGRGSARYAFVETKAPAGHLLDATERPFTLSYANQDTKLVTVSLSAENLPNEVIVDKRILGSDKPLEGASFMLWNTNDQVSAVPQQGLGALAIRAPAAGNLSLKAVLDHASVSASAPEGTSLFLREEGGRQMGLAGNTGTEENEQEKAADHLSIEPGTYQLSLLAGGEEAALPDSEITIEAGYTYRITVDKGLLGYRVHVKQSLIVEDVLLTPDTAQECRMSRSIVPGTYRLFEGRDLVCTIDIAAGTTVFASLEKDSFKRLPILLKPGKNARTKSTDKNGYLRFSHLAEGTYHLAEREAPDGYLIDQKHYKIVVDARGTIEKEKTHTIAVKNDYTKVEISKRDITSEEEVPGARLKIINEAGKTIASWTSTDQPHRIDALKPGTYQLIEEMTPRHYDMANSITFEVEESGEIQPVTMYDEPIEITGEIDKRQEIADPVDPETEPGKGNNARVTISEEGLYDYSIDFRNTSNTWVDEFTVDDEIEAASNGLAQLRGISTPQTWRDFDGLMNIWYRINDVEGDGENDVKDEQNKEDAPDDSIRKKDANATLSDNHDNPWLSHESTREVLGDDGRAISYDGWLLWKRDVSTTERIDLLVSELNLPKDRYVTSVRFEFGRVEKGFTSRLGEWDRELLKDAHDDLDDVLDQHEDQFDAGGASKHYAPAIFHMQVNPSYQEGSILENKAQVKLYRNGGGERLQDDDHDAVIQTPMAKERELPKTGAAGPMAIAVLCALAGSIAWAISKIQDRPFVPKQPKRR